MAERNPMNEKQRQTAGAVWQAYNALETTKRRHFDYLQALESRRNKYNIEPSDAENQMLAQLLRDHDAQVTVFKLATEALRTSNREAFDALWAYINEINLALVPFERKELH
jgi:hypothetical protein